MTRDEILHILDLYFDALKSGRMEAFPFTHDITFEGPMVGTIQGEEEVRKLVGEVARSFQDVDIKVLGHVIDDHEVCSRAAMTLPNGRVVALLDYFRFTDGKISHIQPYFDPRPMEEIWGFAQK